VHTENINKDSVETVLKTSQEWIFQDKNDLKKEQYPKSTLMDQFSMACASILVLFKNTLV
jgi:hypothetical protein